MTTPLSRGRSAGAACDAAASKPSAAIALLNIIAVPVPLVKMRIAISPSIGLSKVGLCGRQGLARACA